MGLSDITWEFHRSQNQRLRLRFQMVGGHCFEYSAAIIIIKKKNQHKKYVSLIKLETSSNQEGKYIHKKILGLLNTVLH